MKRIGIAILLLCAAATASAQVSYDTVTATVRDPDGQALAGARFSMRLVDAVGNPVYSAATPNGQIFNAKPVYGALDASGSFSVGLAPNTILSKPSGTRWLISIIPPLPPDQSQILTYQPPWSINYYATITSSVDLSAQLSGLASNVTYVNLQTGQSTFSGWLTGPAAPTLPCGAGEHEGYFYSSSAGSLYQCTDATGTYQWNQLGGVGGGTTTNPLTAAATGGAAPGTTFNGNAAVTYDYHSFGAAGISGTPTTGNCPEWVSSTQLGDSGAPCGTGGGTGYAVQHEFVFSGAGSQTFAHNLGTLYPVKGCWTKSGAQFQDNWLTPVDANNVTMTAPAATDTVCSFGQTTTPTISAAVASCPDTSGSGTAQSCTTTPSITVAANSCIAYSTTTSNTGTGLTINVNGIGFKSIAIQNGGTWTTVLTSSPATVASGRSYLACYDGTDWDLQTPTAPAPTSGLVNITNSLTWTGCTPSGGVCSPNAQAAVTFSGIPSGYNSIKVVHALEGVGSGDDDLVVSFNGDSTTADYGCQRNGSQSTSTFPGSCSNLGITGGASVGRVSVLAAYAALNVSSGFFEIPFYAAAYGKTGYAVETDSPLGVFNGTFGFAWAKTAAITSVSLKAQGGSALTGSISVYGVN